MLFNTVLAAGADETFSLLPSYRANKFGAVEGSRPVQTHSMYQIDQQWCGDGGWGEGLRIKTK